MAIGPTPELGGTHPLLVRQLRRLGLSADEPPKPAEWNRFLERVSATYVDADQQRYLAGRSLDVSLEEMLLLNNSLETAQSRLEAVFDSTNVGLCVIDADGTITKMNLGAEEELRVIESDVVGQPFWSVISIRSENDVVLDQDAYTAICQAGQAWHLAEATITCDTQTFPAHCSLTPLSGTDTHLQGAVLMIVDRTSAKKAEADLAWRANYDALTGLVNRAALVQRMSKDLASSTDADAAAIFIDLDRFKAVNDSMGHAAGDSLLVDAAARLAVAVRSTDMVSRWSGDEFVIFCAHISETAALELSCRIVRQLELPFSVEGTEVHISASVGVAMSSAGTDASRLVGEADYAMYEAKQAGGGSVQLFTDRSSSRTPARSTVLPITG
jgi:diguanylate cyclase (GGDEF)-like protein/PAS domain S-box-containing protein